MEKTDSKPMPENGYPGKNGGWLRPGNPGNKGGTGRPKDRLRNLACDGFEKTFKQISQKADSEELATPELLNFFDKCGKYGIGTQQEVTQVNVSDELGEMILDWLEAWPISEEARTDLIERMKSLVGG